MSSRRMDTLERDVLALKAENRQLAAYIQRFHAGDFGPSRSVIFGPGDGRPVSLGFAVRRRERRTSSLPAIVYDPMRGPDLRLVANGGSAGQARSVVDHAEAARRAAAAEAEETTVAAIEELAGLRSAQLLKNVGAATTTSLGLSVIASSGLTPVDADAADGAWLQFDTTALSGSSSLQTGALARPQWNATWTARIKTGSSVAAIRAWIGLSDVSFTGSNDPTGNLAAFRYSTGASDTNWMAATNDNSGGCGFTDTGIAVTASTPYTLRAALTATDVKFYIDGALVATRTTNLPTATVALPWWFSFDATPAAIKFFSFGHFGIRYA